MSEINPNHPMTSAMREQWQKLCAILIAKRGGHETISLDDIKLIAEEKAISIQEIDNVIHLRLIPIEEAQLLAREHGGLPT